MLQRTVSLAAELIIAAIIAVAMFALELAVSPLLMMLPNIWGYAP